MDLGPHAPFILASYGATALVLGGLVLRAILDHRAQQRALADLDARGAGRRSREAAPNPVADRREDGIVGQGFAAPEPLVHP